MKTIPIITFFLCTVMYAHAQLNIVPKNDGLKEYTVTNAHPYDSLTNVEKRSFPSLPGQTLYMHGVKNDRNGYWDAFYTVNFLTGDDRTVYKYGAQNETYIEGWEKSTSNLLIYKRLCKI